MQHAGLPSPWLKLACVGESSYKWVQSFGSDINYKVDIVLKQNVNTSSHLCCALQISYAISVSHPLSISVFDYGTSDRDEDQLLQIVQKNFDLRPGIIVKYVQLFIW